MASELIETADRFELVNAVAALALAGDVDEALAGLARVIEVGQRRGDQLAAQTHELWRGLVYYEAGRLLLAEDALAIVEPTPFWELSLPNAYRAGFLAHVLLERGKIDEAEAIVGAVSVEELLPGHRIQTLHGRGRVKLAIGAPEQALADFIAAGEAAESVDIRNPAYIPWRSQAALALHQLARDRRSERRLRARNSSCRVAGAHRARSASRCACSVSSRVDEPASSCCARRSMCSRIRRPGSSMRGRSIDLGARSAAWQQPQRGSAVVAAGSRARAPLRRDRARRARERRTCRDRRSSTHDPAQRRSTR